MWRPPSWSRSTLLHEWIRSGGILIAAAWGVHTFVWKDVLVPSWQPAHLNLDASLRPVPTRPATAQGLEMVLEVRATNASRRRVYPLANIWWLTGIKRDPRPGSMLHSDRLFRQESDQVLKGVALQHAERAVVSTTGELLAIGRLFDDEFIEPGNFVNRSILVRIPKEYGAAELSVTLPLLTRQSDGLLRGQRLTWGLSDYGDPTLLVCSETSSDSNVPKPQCKSFDSTIENELRRFDPKQSTITLNQQIGLPPSLDQ